MRVVQITDIHLTPIAGTKLYDVDTGAALENTIQKINQLTTPPDFIIATGDLTEDGAAKTYQRLQQLLQPLNTPVYALPGNHDNPQTMHTALTNGQIHYKGQAKINNWGFIFLDTQVKNQSHGYIDPQQLTTLQQNIEALKDHPTLIAMHHGPTNHCPSTSCQLQNATEFTNLLKQYPNVKATIAGHTHNALEITQDHHIQYTTPSTFAHATHAQLGESPDHEDFWASHTLDPTKQGFRVLDLAPTGTISSEVHWL